MKFGLYETIINNELASISEEEVQIQKSKVDDNSAPKILAKYFSRILEKGLTTLKESDVSVEKQVEFCNYLIEQVSNRAEDKKVIMKLKKFCLRQKLCFFW